MRIQPLGDRVIVRRVEEKRDSLIELPDAHKSKPQIGVVLEVGDEVNSKGSSLNAVSGVITEIVEPKKRLKEGDLVLFSSHAGKEFELSGEETLLILRLSEVEGVLVPEEEKPAPSTKRKSK